MQESYVFLMYYPGPSATPAPTVIRTLEEITVEFEGDRIVVIHAMKVTREHLKYLEKIL